MSQALMKYRLPIFVLAVVLLVILNVWRWWPSGMDRPVARSQAGHSGPFREEDFSVIALPPPETLRSSGRDLFQPVLKAPPPVAAKSKVASPPPKSPEQLAEEAARAELAQIKVMGVLFRGGKGQAYVLSGTETSLVTAGEKVGTRFVVLSIENDTVEIKDPITNVSGRIPVSGK